jgi:hypothetical protein
MISSAIQLISPNALRAALAFDLGFASSAPCHDVLIAQALRRLCGIMCPSPRERIRECAMQSLAPLFESSNTSLQQTLDDAFEALLLAGDLIEVTENGVEAKTDMYLCPPSFMELGERLYIMGIANDDASFLPEEVKNRLVYKGATRFLPDIDTADGLREIGLREVSSKHWFKKFDHGSAEEFRACLEERLTTCGKLGGFDDVRLLAHSDGRTTYRQRWNAPYDENGLHIFRVERAYGAAAWFIGEFSRGECKRYIVMDPLDAPGRACDAAWLAQLAIDATNGRPNAYDVSIQDDYRVIKLGFPLPGQAHRRLSVLAGRMQGGSPQDPLVFPTNTVGDAEAFLQAACWFVKA